MNEHDINAQYSSLTEVEKLNLLVTNGLVTPKMMSFIDPRFYTLGLDHIRNLGKEKWLVEKFKEINIKKHQIFLG